MAPEIDAPLVAAANAAPYLSAAVALAVRRGGVARRWSVAVGAGLLAYVLLMVLLPVGDVIRAREPWAFYALTFFILGLLSWAALSVLWLTWLVWSGRVWRRLPRQSDPRHAPPGSNAIMMAGFVVGGTAVSAGSFTRETAPTWLLGITWDVALIPWLYPLSSIPVVGPYLWIPGLVSILAPLVVIFALVMTDRRPRILLPRDLRDEPAELAAREDWPFGVALARAALVAAITGGVVAVVELTTHWPRPVVRGLALPLVLVVGIAVFVPAAGRRRRGGGR